MIKKVLEDTDTEGQEFKVQGGTYQILVVDFVSAVTLEIQNPEDDTDWISTNQDWSAEGVKAMYLAWDSIYRMNTSVAGASAWVMNLREFIDDTSGVRA